MQMQRPAGSMEMHRARRFRPPSLARPRLDQQYIRPVKIPLQSLSSGRPMFQNRLSWDFTGEICKTSAGQAQSSFFDPLNLSPPTLRGTFLPAPSHSDREGDMTILRLLEEKL